MTSASATGEWLLALLRENAFAMILAALGAYAWFTSNNAELNGRLTDVEREVSEHRTILKARTRFVNDATNQLNFLCATAPTCRQLYAPIVAPE